MPELDNTLNIYNDIKIGIIGGSLQAFICMPLLTWKFSIQSKIRLPKIIEPWNYYRGSIQQITAHTPNTVIQIVSHNILLNKLNKNNISIYEKIGCSSISGIIGAIIFTPVDNLTIIQQMKNISLFKAVNYKNIIISTNKTESYTKGKYFTKNLFFDKKINNKLRTPIFSLIQKHLNKKLQKKQIIKSYNKINYFEFNNLYKGFNATVIRESIYCIGLLTLGPIFTTILERNSKYFNNNRTNSNLIGSLSSGLVASIISHPIDIVKTRIQHDLTSTNYVSITQVISKMVKEEGIQSLYIGIVPRSMQIMGAFYIINSVKKY